jgi:hypothetical protein
MVLIGTIEIQTAIGVGFILMEHEKPNEEV